MQELRRLRFWALGAMVSLAAGCASLPHPAQPSAAANPPTASPQQATTPAPQTPPAVASTPPRPAPSASQSAAADDDNDTVAIDANAPNPTPASSATSAAQTALDDDGKDVKPDYANIWQRIRAGFNIPDMQGPAVDAAVQWYVTRPDYIARMTERARKYLYYTVQAVQQRGMPTELALLPFVESAYNPDAKSVAHAVGMWQFIPSTGKHYNLKQNLFQDDRRSVLASTNAALDYLQNLYTMFGDWQLALAAYNWGEGSLQRAIAYNVAHDLPTDYQSLRMPNETRNYFPKLQAVKDIIADPAKYGLTLPDIPDHPYFKAVTITRDIDVSLAAKLAGITPAEFRSLNPAYTKPVILGANNPRILLPYDNAAHFQQALQSYNGQLATWTVYRVDRTESPLQIARKLGLPEAELRDTNDIPPRKLVRAGSTLLVPKPEDAGNKNISAHLADNAMIALAPEAPAGKRLRLRVGRGGDSVERVAHRYHLSVEDVAMWNRTTPRGVFRPGQFVTVYVTHTPRIFVAEERRAAQLRAEDRRPVQRKRVEVASRTRHPVKKNPLHYSVRTSSDKRPIYLARR